MKSVNIWPQVNTNHPLHMASKGVGETVDPTGKQCKRRSLGGKAPTFKGSTHPSILSRRRQCCLVTYVQREAWGKEHNVYASRRASGPFLSSGPELLFQMPMKGEDSPSLCLPLPAQWLLRMMVPHSTITMGTHRYNRLLQQALAIGHPQIEHQSPNIWWRQKSTMPHFTICDKFVNQTKDLSQRPPTSRCQDPLGREVPKNEVLLYLRPNTGYLASLWVVKNKK